LSRKKSAPGKKAQKANKKHKAELFLDGSKKRWFLSLAAADPERERLHEIADSFSAW